jgi:hypothetical protein
VTSIAKQAPQTSCLEPFSNYFEAFWVLFKVTFLGENSTWQFHSTLCQLENRYSFDDRNRTIIALAWRSGSPGMNW